MNHLGTDVVGKRKFRAALKDDKDKIVDEFFFSNERNGILSLLSRIQSHGKCVAVLESIGNMWMRIHDLLGEIGIDTKLTNPYKTKIIATEAKIKSDKLDADRILSDLLWTDLIYETYVPKQENRDKRSLVMHRITLSRTKTKLVNKVHSILLDKYDYRTVLTDIFSKSGIEWLKSLTPLVTPVDKIILDTSIGSIEIIDQQINAVSKEISNYAGDNKA
jgi:transposase